jgi:hypothetical protein
MPHALAHQQALILSLFVVLGKGFKQGLGLIELSELTVYLYQEHGVVLTAPGR